MLFEIHTVISTLLGDIHKTILIADRKFYYPTQIQIYGDLQISCLYITCLSASHSAILSRISHVHYGGTTT